MNALVAEAAEVHAVITEEQTTSVQGQYVIQCTAGAPFKNSAGTVYMMTAGHCGPTGTLWYQGYFDGTTIQSFGTMGTVASQQWGNNRTDGETLSGSSYSPYVWTNGPSYQSSHVLGAATVTAGSTGQGTQVCTAGSFTLFACGGNVYLKNVCLNLNDNGTTVTVCGQDLASSSTRIVQHGDSGGPVLVQTSGGVKLAGVISGGNDAGTQLNFSDVSYLQTIFSLTVLQ